MKDSGLLILTDADNTLWDTDRVFASAQIELLRDVERLTGKNSATEDQLSFVRAFDQELARLHHASLRYPAHLLVRAIIHGLYGSDPRVAAKSSWRSGNWKRNSRICEGELMEIEQSYSHRLSIPPQLRPGVTTGLVALSQRRLFPIVVTESAKRRCIELLAFHRLDSMLQRVIEAPKTTQLYKRVHSTTKSGSQAVMIGDQLDRDIAPAKIAGLVTVYFPGGFVPSWAPQSEVVNPDYTVESFYELVAIADQHSIINASTGATI